MKIRGALIGCGHISSLQLWAWRQIDQVEICAVCDLDREKAEARASEFNIPLVYTNYEEMLDEVELDFVDIATRPSAHLGLILSAAKRGLHVLCQKPLTDSLLEAQQMVDACRAAGVTFMVNENGRFQAWFRQMKEMLDRGDLGKLFYARIEERSRATLPQLGFGEQPYLSEMPRLVIYEMGLHYLDTARYLFGESRYISAVTKRISPYIAGEDVAIILADFDDLTCVVDLSWASVAEPSPELTWGHVRIEGENGTLVLDMDGVLTLYTDSKHRSWVFPKDTLEQSFVAAQAHFAECLKTGREPETSGAETIKSLQLVFSSYQSAEEQRAASLGQSIASA